MAKAFYTATDPKSLTHGKFAGTPAFASPEQFEHSALDVRSDIYSLGETLWFALTGKTPFAGRTLSEIYRAQKSNELPVERLNAAHVPARLRLLLQSMLAFEPASRPRTKELAARLQGCSPEDTRIFVSYAREDQVPVEALVNFLRATRFEVWFDKDKLYAGEDWRVVIEQEIAQARLMIICLSQNSIDKTGFVQKEMRLALQQAELRPFPQIYIIPVNLDGCPVPVALERLHVLDLSVPDASYRLLEAIINATGVGASTPRDDHDALTITVNNYRRELKGLPPEESGLGEVVKLKDYSNRILGRWLGPRKYVTFFADGSWGVQRNEDAPIQINGRRWRIEGNELLLTWLGDSGLMTAESTITSFTTKQFITEDDGHKGTYDWAP